MSTPLLQTKLFAPQHGATDIVIRPRLSRLLDRTFDCKLTLISAPAGFGKTTLVAAWLAELQSADSPPSRAQITQEAHNPNQLPGNQRPINHQPANHGLHSNDTVSCIWLSCTWLSLDENDNELSRFLSYFVAAIQKSNPDVGEDAWLQLHSPQPLQPNILLTSLINDVVNLPQQLVLVLDDYHLIHESAIHKAVTFWLEHGPPNAHIVMTTRVDPELPLALLRSRGQMNEIRIDDLRFTHEEIGQFLHTTMQIDLSQPNISALATRTEGWIAGLQMAGLSMRGQDDITAFIENFTGSHRYIIDYLADEVLDQCQPKLRHFLLGTSILGRMCGPLCEAILNALRFFDDLADKATEAKLPSANTKGLYGNSPNAASYAQAILEEMEANNLFVIPLDNERRWYRYHHLFGDLLQHRLRREFPGVEKHLHHHASLWHEHSGDITEAVNHALAASNFQRAATLIEPIAHEMANKMQLFTLGRWIEALPNELLFQHPRIVHPYAMVLSLTSRYDEYGHYLQTAEQAALANPEQPESQTILGQVTIQKCIQSFFLGDFERALERVDQAHQRLPTYNFPTERWELASIRGYSLLQWHGNGATALADLLDAIRIAANDQGPVGSTFCNAFLSNTYLCLGQLHDAHRSALAGLDSATLPDGSLLPAAPYPQLLLARNCYERNELDKAMTYLAPITEQLENVTGLTTDPVDTTLTMAMMKQVQGDEADALTVIAEAEHFFRNAPISDAFRSRFGAIKARIHLMQGNLQAAKRWAEDQQMRPEKVLLRPIHLFVMLTWVRIQLALAQYKAADALLTRCHQWAWQQELTGVVVECAMLQALSTYARDELEEALSFLEEALRLAAPQRYVRLFVDEGEPMQMLLKEAVARGIAVDYSLTLLAAFGIPSRETSAWPAQPAGNAALVEPLSPRELEILQQIATGQTNQQIADELIIAVSTVKRHINNIYGKLHAQSRTHALARARELKLL
ncbi:MAG: LuxR C-terminal-related transcriptional regulator [Chloroflexota bacterium]